jgi:hypothetical protein
MVVVLVSAVAIAALRSATDTWAGIMLLLTLGLLACSLLGVRQRREARRAFWEGFAIFGWGYLILAFGPWFAEQVTPRLPTAQILTYLHSKIASSVTNIRLDGSVSLQQGGSTLTADSITFTVQGSGGSTTVSPQGFVSLAAGGFSNYDSFVRIGQCLFALLAALTGAMVSRWMYAKERRRQVDSDEMTISGHCQ